jgi:pilus assembly protein CpaB
MGRRTVLLIAALVVAALGTTGVFLYVNGVDRRAEAGLEMVNVLVASENIPAGTTAQAATDAGSLELRKFTKDSVKGLPALSDTSGIATQVALAPISTGEPILSTQFGSASETNQLPIPDGKLAVSIQMGDPERVAGFVGPNSNVAVFLTTTPATGANAGQELTRVLLPTVQVIAAGQTTVVTTTSGSGQAAQTEQIPKAILTLAVDQTEAEKIVYASAHGQMYFGLLRDNSKVDKTDSGVSAENLFSK